MEIWDAYDIDGNLIPDMKLIRGEPIPDGIYHLVTDIIVRHIDGQYLLMKRDRNKKNGGLWEASAGGSAFSGETPLQCAFRELREETGIVANELIEIGTIMNSDTHGYYFEYLAVVDIPKDSIILQKDETEDYKWVDKDTLKSMKKDEKNRKKISKKVVYPLEKENQFIYNSPVVCLGMKW